MHFFKRTLSPETATIYYGESSFSPRILKQCGGSTIEIHRIYLYPIVLEKTLDYARNISIPNFFPPDFPAERFIPEIAAKLKFTMYRCFQLGRIFIGVKSLTNTRNKIMRRQPPAKKRSTRFEYRISTTYERVCNYDNTLASHDYYY